jgi:hypothetical protein
MRPMLFVRTGSMPYVRRLITSFHQTLCAHYGAETALVLGDAVDAAPLGDADTVLVVGEALGRFTRKPGRRYIYLNFSVVSYLGNPLNMTLNGLRLIQQKRRLLNAKLDLFDAVLDYYPAQTIHLKRHLSLPVFGFLPTIAPPARSSLRLDARKYDVCFVGSGSPRRDQLADVLRRRGVTLTPQSGMDLEDFAAQSRCTLNVHLQRSNHLELPRILGAMSAGSPVITEKSYAIEDVIPATTLAAIGNYGSLATLTADALKDMSALQQKADMTDSWYRTSYMPRAETMLIDTLNEVAGLRQA